MKLPEMPQRVHRAGVRLAREAGREGGFVT